MSTEKIVFFKESIDFTLPNSQKYTDWLQLIIQKEAGRLIHLNIIFCSDAYLLDLNISYLDHDTLTDIITFPLSSFPLIEGDVFISIERVSENSSDLKLPFEEELLRVLAHGVLHLCGYNDKEVEDIAVMRQKEEEYIQLFSEI
jgi:probable rRNA maturation factor